MSEPIADNVAGLRTRASTCERQRDWAGFVDVCRRIAAHPDAGADAVSYLQKAAVATESHLKELDRAAETWREVLARAPDNRYAFAALRRIYSARRSWEQLEELSRQRGAIRTCLQAFEDEAKRAEGAERVDLLLRIGRLNEEVGAPSNRARAMEAYEAARALDPENLVVAVELCRLYDPERQTAQLLDVMRAAGPALDPDEAAPIFRRLAQVAEAAGDSAQAISAYEAVLQHAGDDLQAVTRLVTLHAAREDWPAVERLVVTRGQDLAAQLLETPEERDAFVAMTGTIADIEAPLAVGGQALEWYQRALEIDPDDPRLARACQRMAEASQDPTRRAELLAQAAALWRRRGDAARAFAALLEVVRASPQDEGAISAFEEAAAIEDRWEEVAQAYRDIAAQPLMLDDQIRIRLRLARVYAEIGDDERATRTYARVIDLSPTGQGIEELARLYEKRRRYGDLYKLLQDKLLPLCDEAGKREVDARLKLLLRDRMAEASPTERAALAGEMAGSEEDNATGFDALLSLLMNEAVVDRPTLKAFERLAEKTGRWDDYLATCEQVARRVEQLDPSHAVELWLKIATTYEVRRDDTGSALIATERASQLEPGRLDLLVRRAELHRRREEWQEHDRLMSQLGAPTD